MLPKVAAPCWSRRLECRGFGIQHLWFCYSRGFPKDELYGLVSQMRRASISVASNIAEGRGRLSPAEFRQFLSVAQGSIFELKTQLIVARKLGIGESKELDETEAVAGEVSKMLASLIAKVHPALKAES